MNKILWMIIGGILIAAAGVTAGYFWGKNNVKTATIVRERFVTRIKGEEVVREIVNPIPIEIHDTTTILIPEPTDTAALYAVWRDYYLSREYELDFSNDTIGEFKVTANVTQNRLESATSKITPKITTITEKTTTDKVKTIGGYILLGTSVDFGTNQLGAGIDIKERVMLGASAVRMNNNWSYTINLGVRF